MNKLITANILAAMAALVVMSGCMKGKGGGETTVVFKQPEGKTIAQVGSSILTVEGMKEDFLRRQGQFKGAPNLNTDKARSDYVESQVMQEAMFLEAVAEGYFRKPDILADVKKMVVQKMMRDKLEKAQADFVPTEEDIKNHYDKHKNLYFRDEAVKVAFISVPFGNSKPKAKDLAQAMYKEAMETAKNANSKAFSRVAMNHAEKVAALGPVSIETNETDYLEKDAFEEKFGKASFDKIKNLAAAGDLSPVIESNNAFVVMMKTGSRKELNESLEDARAKIVKRLAYESRGENYKKYTESLKKKYDIKVYNELVAELSKGIEQPQMAELPKPADGQPPVNTPPKPSEV